MDLYTLFIILIPVLAFGFALGRWARRAAPTNPTDPAAAADAGPAASAAAESWPEQQLPGALRLEAAAPAEVVAGRPFDVYVALLPPDDPRALPDVLRAAAPPAPPPPGARALRFRVRVEAPGWVIEGPAEQPARWWPGGPPPVLAFRLAAERPGGMATRLVVAQGLTEVGQARLNLRAAATPAVENGAADPTTVTAQVVIAPRAPEAADQLLAHAIAESYTADELAALAEELGASAPPPGASTFTTALDVVHHAARRGAAEALAARVAAERPEWRRAIRGNLRAERLVGENRK